MTGPLGQPIPFGAIVGEFADYDGLVERLRERAASVGLSYRIIEELAEMGEGSLAKYLSDIRVKQFTVGSLVRVAAVMGVRCMFVIDDNLLREMRPFWELRDGKKAHARRRASLGRVTMERLLPVAFSELGKIGAKARNSKLTPHRRKRIAQRAAKARWSKKP
jgi:hypothetical protein